MVYLYAYLIMHKIATGNARKIVCNMNLHYESSKTTEDNVEIQSYRENFSNALASENNDTITVREVLTCQNLLEFR